MTKLTAKATARIALEKRKLQDRATIVRGRVEALPQLQLGGLIDRADQMISMAFYARAKEVLDDIDDRIARHQVEVEAADAARAAQMQDQLLRERGVETYDHGVARTRDGWKWLTSRQPARLQGYQIGAGDRYAALYAFAHRDGLCVGANDNAGGEPTVEELRRRAVAKHEASQALRAIHRHLDDSTGSERLSGLLEAVCGRGESLRSLALNDDRKALAYEAELRLALDMTAVAFKMMPKREVAA